MVGFRNLDLLLALQRGGTPFLDSVMRGLSFLGSEFFYFAVLVFLYWSGKRKLAISLACTVLVSLYVSFLLKDLFQVPRPSGVGLRILETPEDFSFPSGHAQSTAAFWFFLAFSLGKTPLFILGGVLVALVALSRLYLGVHYLEDVLFGALLGFGFALGFSRVFRIPVRRNIPFPLALAFLGSGSVVLFSGAPSPLAVKTAGSLSGALFGYTLALWSGLEEKRVPLATFLLGVGTLVLCYLGGKAVPVEHKLWLWGRYFALTLYATFLFPLCISRYGARRHTESLP